LSSFGAFRFVRPRARREDARDLLEDLVVDDRREDEREERLLLDDFVADFVLEERLGDLKRDLALDSLEADLAKDGLFLDRDEDFRGLDLLLESKTYSPFLFSRICNRDRERLKLGLEDTYLLVDLDRVLGDFVRDLELDSLKSNAEFFDLEDDFLNLGGAGTNFPSTRTIASFVRLVYLAETFGLDDFLDDFFLEDFFEFFFLDAAKDLSTGGFLVDFLERVCIFRFFFLVKIKIIFDFFFDGH
jgi:hypothetical protein